MEKICVICGNLFKPKTSNKTCSKDCNKKNKSREIQRRYRKRHPERPRISAKKWREKYPERRLAYVKKAWREDPHTKSKRLRAWRIRTKLPIYKKQEGKCAGCGHKFPFHGFVIDHINPKSNISKEQYSNKKNWQLLCHYCNSLKGKRDNSYLHDNIEDRLKEIEDIKKESVTSM